MLRAISLAILMIFSVPSAFAASPDEDTAIAQQQQQQPVQSAPRRGCDKKQDEGVS